MAKANTQAYYVTAIITTIKSFIVQDPILRSLNNLDQSVEEVIKADPGSIL